MVESYTKIHNCESTKTRFAASEYVFTTFSEDTVKNTVLPAALMVLSVVVVYANAEAEKYFARLKKKWGTTSAVEAVCVVSGTADTMKVAVQKGKGYRITSSRAVVVSNGTTVWNANVQQKKVVISSVSDDNRTLGPEDILLELTMAFDAVKVETVRGGKRLTLKPTSGRSSLSGLSAVELSLSPAEQIQGLRVEGDGVEAEWSVVSLNFMGSLDASTLQYTPPKGWKVIDLR